MGQADGGVSMCGEDGGDRGVDRELEPGAGTRTIVDLDMARYLLCRVHRNI